MSETGPLVSVIMPNFNGAKYLRLALDSFLECGYRDKELIVVDGKSTDSSHHTLSEYEEKYGCIEWIRYADSGISDAINEGVRLSKGQVIGYLGSDDLMNSDTLSLVANYKK